MTPSERKVRAALRKLIRAVDSYADAHYFGPSDDDDPETERAAKQVDRAMIDARRALAEESP